VPAIAPDFEPIKEVLVEGRTGWMFQAGDLDAAVDRVLQLSGDSETLSSVGANARTYITEQRQWRHNILQLAQFHDWIRSRAGRTV
jgi:glycosyltransferase involved in cell wall biosynthesis